MLKSPTKEPSGLGIGLCSLERPMGECSTHCGAGYLEKAKLSETCLLRLKVSNRRGSRHLIFQILSSIDMFPLSGGNPF